MNADERLARIMARMEAIEGRTRVLGKEELAFEENVALASREARGPASSLAEARSRRYVAEETARSAAELAVSRAAELEGLEREHAELREAIVEILPERVWVRHPLKPKAGLMLYKSTKEDLGHDEDDPCWTLSEEPWRLVRNAPPDAPPDVVSVARGRLRSTLSDEVFGFAKWALLYVLVAVFLGYPHAETPLEATLAVTTSATEWVAGVGTLWSLISLCWFLCFRYAFPKRTLEAVAAELSFYTEAKAQLARKGLEGATKAGATSSGAVPQDERPRSEGGSRSPAELQKNRPAPDGERSPRGEAGRSGARRASPRDTPESPTEGRTQDHEKEAPE